MCWLSCRHAPLCESLPLYHKAFIFWQNSLTLSDVAQCRVLGRENLRLRSKLLRWLKDNICPPLATDLQMESERNFTPVEMHLGLIFHSAALCFCCATLGERQTLLSLISSRQHARGITGVTLCNVMFLKSLPLLTAAASPWIFGRTSILTYWPPQLSTCWFRWA